MFRVEQALFALTPACFEQPKSDRIHRGCCYLACIARVPRLVQGSPASAGPHGVEKADAVEE